MNTKALIEKKNVLMTEAEALLNTCEAESRGLVEEELNKYNEIKMQIEDINNTLAIAEERNKEAVVEKVENIINDKIEGEETMGMNVEKRAIEQFVRKQDGEELRSMNITTGGALVPTHLHGEIIEKLEQVAPLFAMGRRFTPVSGTLEILREDNIGAATWVGDMTNLTATDFTVKKAKLEQVRCGSAIELSQHLINDSGIDIVDYAINLLTKRIGYALDRAVIAGNTENNQFEGLVNAPEACQVETAATGAIALDDYLLAYNTMHPDYVQNAVWVMSRQEFNKLAALKDAVGHYYITRDVVANGPVYKLFGAPVYINDAVPTDAESKTPVAFLVDFNSAYATMVKKDMELKHITGDTQSALRGSQTLVMDLFCDAKIINPEAIKVLVRK